MQINIPDLYGTEHPNILALKLINNKYHIIDIRHIFKDGAILDSRENHIRIINCIFAEIDNALRTQELSVSLLSEQTYKWLESMRNGTYDYTN